MSLRPTGSSSSSGSGFQPKGNWTANTAYVTNDIVQNGGSTYRVKTAHVSPATFPTTFPDANLEEWAKAGSALSLGTNNSTTAYGWAVKDYDIRKNGAKCDGRWITVTTTAGSPVVSAPPGTFTAADQGKLIGITGGGTAGVDFAGFVNSYDSATQITLSQPVPTAVASAKALIGSNDTTAIVNTINDAKAATLAGVPAMVYVPGISCVNAAIATDWGDNLGMRGNGPGRSAIYAISNSQFGLITGTSRSTANPYDRVHFMDIELDGRFMAAGIYGIPQKGIFIQYMTKAIFQNVVCSNWLASGLGIDFLVDSVIYGCRADGNGRGNNGTQGGGNGFGIGSGMFAIENLVIEACHANGNKRFGIFSEVNGLTSGSYMIVKGCTSTNNQYGIGNCGNTRMVIQGNTVYTNTVAGIFSGKGTVGTGTGFEALISGNTVYENLDGIVYDSSNATGFGYHDIRDNRVARNTRHGIRLETNTVSAIPAMNVVDNEVYQNGAIGIYVKGGNTTVQATDLNIEGNRCYSNGQTDVSGLTQGIRLDISTTRLSLKDNKCFDTAASGSKKQTYGVQLSSTYTHTDPAIIDNLLSANATSGILQAATLAGTTTTRGNVGYTTATSGKAVFSGDGSTTSFTFPHNCDVTPSTCTVTPGSAAAMGNFYVTIAATTITVTYQTAPVAGANNVVLNYSVANSSSGVAALLDQLTGITGAFSLRRILTGYSGNAIKVRRSSDNATQDIGFTVAGDLDTVALLTFCGAGDGFIDTWYDQSGNGLHLTQSTAAAQFRIVGSGVVDTKNGKPAAQIMNATSGYTSAIFTTYTGNTLCGSVVGSLANVTSSGRYLVALNTSDTELASTAAIVIGRQSANQTWGTNRNSVFVATAGGTYTNLQAVQTVHDGTNAQLTRDGVAGTAVASSGAFAIRRISLCGAGSATTFTSPSGGYIAEAIFKVSAGAWDSTALATIRGNQKTYFGTA